MWEPDKCSTSYFQIQIPLSYNVGVLSPLRSRMTSLELFDNIDAIRQGKFLIGNVKGDKLIVDDLILRCQDFHI